MLDFTAIDFETANSYRGRLARSALSGSQQLACGPAPLADPPAGRGGPLRAVPHRGPRDHRRMVARPRDGRTSCPQSSSTSVTSRGRSQRWIRHRGNPLRLRGGQHRVARDAVPVHDGDRPASAQPALVPAAIFVAELVGGLGDHHDPLADAGAVVEIVRGLAGRHNGDSLEDLALAVGIPSGTCVSWRLHRQRRNWCRRDVETLPVELNTDADPDGYLYGRVVVFTGTVMSMTRHRVERVRPSRSNPRAESTTRTPTCSSSATSTLPSFALALN